MLKNYLKIAWRSIYRQKLYSLINILGLTIGLSSFLLIFLYIQDEQSYDQMHPDHANVYKMSYLRQQENGEIEHYSTSGTTWAPRYQAMMPEVTDYVLLNYAGYPGYINREAFNEAFIEPDFRWVTDNFFEFFSFPLVRGDPKTVLSTRNSVIMTESMVRKYFGKEDPMGATLLYNVSGLEANLTVTGIMKDPPANTHLKPTFVGNIKYIHDLYFQNYQYDFLNQPGDAFAFTYLKVNDPKILPRIADDWKSYLTEAFANNENQTAEAYHEVQFTALSDIHFAPGAKWDLEAPADPSYIPIFFLAAFLVLLIACINFMNLATARSAKRAREIGLRKTLGSSKGQLVRQFFGESFVMTFMAVLLSFGVIWLVLPFFNDVANKAFTLRDLLTLKFSLITLAITLLVALLAGSYPALYLSGFDAMSSLRGLFTSGRKAELVRKGLVVFQFAVAIILMVCTMVVYNQLQLIHNTNLGQDKDRILSIRLGGFGLGQRAEVFMEQVKQDLRFEDLSIANHLPRLPNFGLINTNFRFPERNNEELEWNKFDVDFEFPKTFNLSFLAGRDYDPQNTADSNAIILNEAAIKSLKISADEALGLVINDRVYNQQLQQQVELSGRVIGVVEDFPYKSVNSSIEPLVMWGTPSPIDRILYVKMTPGNYDEKLAFLSEKWRELIPGMPMESWFMDFEFGRLYENERRLSKIFILFATITIFIAMLGLFALTSYTTEQRRKEIGVRKVLGASENSLVYLLLLHFFKLVGWAFILSVPISYFLMDRWLDNFVYRVSISFGIIVGAAILVSVVTFVTVSLDTFKAARANPIQSLKVD